jgi:transposase
MHINSKHNTHLTHLNFGRNLTTVCVPVMQLRCPVCSKTKCQNIPFKAEDHMITKSLLVYINELLSTGVYSNKEIAKNVGLSENTIKKIDLKRLQNKLTTDNGTKLKQPEKQAKYLGIDEFKLHIGHGYATHIIDLETGNILWIQKGKKKEVVYDFIKHVGKDWMDGVEAVACDMNSDFQEAFESECPWIQPVFDFFHIVKNFNDKVVNQIRKDEQERLSKEGNITALKSLKNSKYILVSNRETLKKKNIEASSGRIIHKGSQLFKTDDITRKTGYESKYDELIKENKLLFTEDLVKEKLHDAYKMTNEIEMTKSISEIITICKETKNKNFEWFGRLLENHFEGIIAHATYKISSGKIEGINQKIKKLRRHGYGYPDDEYFFLKIMEASRNKYKKNLGLHKIIK